MCKAQHKLQSAVTVYMTTKLANKLGAFKFEDFENYEVGPIFRPFDHCPLCYSLPASYSSPQRVRQLIATRPVNYPKQLYISYVTLR